MNFKTTYVLFAVLAGVLAILAITLWLGPTSTTDTDYALPSLHDSREPVAVKDIDTIEIHRYSPKEQLIVFVRDRDHDTWKMTEPYELRVDKFQIDRLLNQITDARKDEKAELSSDLKQWGLDTPSTKITIKKGPDHSWELNLGKERPGEKTGAVYVTSSDHPKEPMAVHKKELDLLFKPINEYRTKDMLVESALNVQYVNMKEPKHDAVILDKASDGQWRFEKPAFGEAADEGERPADGATTKDISGVRDLLKAIEDIKVADNSDFVADGVRDMAQYGLGKDPERLRIETKSRVGNALGGDEKKEPLQDALLVGKKADAKGDKLYARLESENSVVKIPAKSIEGIVKVIENPAVLRNRDLVQIDQAKTDAIDLKNAAGLLKLRKQEGSWKLYDASGKQRNADDTAVADLLTALNAKRTVRSFPDPAKEKEYGFDKPESVVSIWVEGIQKDEEKKEDKAAESKDKKDEKKDEKKETKKDTEPKLKDAAKPTVQLTFGKKDKDLVYVRRDKGGDKFIGAVPDTLLAKVTGGPLAFLDRHLPSFSESAEVAGVVLDRGGQVYEADKDKDVWKLKQPKTLAGQTADALNVERIINELRSLRPEKLVAEQASAADLEKFGLKQPQLKATVKVQNKETKKTEDWVYLFGKEEDKTGVYAKQEKHDLVFLVRPTVLETLRSELRDPTVLHFDAAKVKGVKLIGWKQIVGSTITLDLEHKSAHTWVVKAPADFELDNDRADAFITGLVDLKAEKFMPRKELKDRALQIEITVEGEKAPLTLTIGDLDAKEKAYYGQSSTVPDSGFLLAQSRFEQVLTGAKYFSKAKAGK
jgi:hypothetical protein